MYPSYLRAVLGLLKERFPSRPEIAADEVTGPRLAELAHDERDADEFLEAVAALIDMGCLNLDPAVVVEGYIAVRSDAA